MTEETNTPVISWDVNKAAIAEVAEDLKDIDAYQDLPAAKAAKKTLTKMRTALGEAHKETKAEALAFGRKVDAKKNEYLALIREIEDPISQQLDEINNAERDAEEQRVQIRMDEIERIQAYALDRHSLTLIELEQRLENLRRQESDPDHMMEWADDWDLAKQEADLKLRLAIDREKKEIEARREKEALEEENKKLREEAAERKAEQAERDAEAKKEAAELERVNREEAEARQADLDRQQAEIDKERQEREEAEEMERQRKAKAEEEEEAQKLRDLQAPDVDKLKKYAEAIDHLIGLRPVMGSTAGNSALLDTIALLTDAADIIVKHIEEMK